MLLDMEMEGRAEQGQQKKGRVCSSLWLESCPAAGTRISTAGECISGVILKVAGVGAPCLGSYRAMVCHREGKDEK